NVSPSLAHIAPQLARELAALYRRQHRRHRVEAINHAIDAAIARRLRGHALLNLLPLAVGEVQAPVLLLAVVRLGATLVGLRRLLLGREHRVARGLQLGLGLLLGRDLGRERAAIDFAGLDLGRERLAELGACGPFGLPRRFELRLLLARKSVRWRRQRRRAE